MWIADPWCLPGLSGDDTTWCIVVAFTNAEQVLVLQEGSLVFICLWVVLDQQPRSHSSDDSSGAQDDSWTVKDGACGCLDGGDDKRAGAAKR